VLLSDVTPTPDLTCADIKEPDLFVDAGCEWMDTGFSTTQETTERSGSTKGAQKRNELEKQNGRHDLEQQNRTPTSSQVRYWSLKSLNITQVISDNHCRVYYEINLCISI